MADLIEIKMPEDQQEGTASTVGSWLKQVGDAVTAAEPVVELETDKVNMEVAAPADGVLSEILKQEGDTVEPGEVLATMKSGVAASKEPEAPEAATPAPAANLYDPPSPEPAGSDRSHLLSPSVRKLFAQHGLDHTMVKGSGKDGRITYNDVRQYLESSPAKPAPSVAKPTAPVVHAPVPGGSRRVPHDTMRRRIADHMVDSLLRVAPHVTSVFEMDMTAIMRHRAANKADFAQKGVNLTYTAYFVLASVEALQAVPEVNSRFHPDALEIFDDKNIGVGTALGDKGLIVPVIKSAQHLNLFGAASKLQDITQRARQNKLQPGDVQGGTFTISNHGVSGSLIAAPIIINQPQSAILGIGKMQKRVVVIDLNGQDATVIKPMCYVTLSIDHRVLDAYQCNAFLSRFVEVIETWT